MENNKFKNFLIILFLGGFWGFIEATLGTLIHEIPVRTLLLSSTAILLPIAYFIMGRGYKLTGKASTAFYIGLVAACIKAVCFFFIPAINKVINPMVAIVLESSIIAIAFKLVQPKKLISISSFVTFVVASFVIRTTYVGYSIATAIPFKSAYISEGTLVWSQIIKYVVYTNLVSFVYLGIYMCFGLAFKFLENNKKFINVSTKITKLAYSPIFAVLMFVISISVTAILK